MQNQLNNIGLPSYQRETLYMQVEYSREIIFAEKYIHFFVVHVCFLSVLALPPTLLSVLFSLSVKIQTFKDDGKCCISKLA